MTTTKRNAMYFTTSKSVRVGRNGSYYWHLHQDTGHILRTSDPFDTMDACLSNIVTDGAAAYHEWKEQGLI